MKKFIGVAIVFFLFSTELVLWDKISPFWFWSTVAISLVASFFAIKHFFKKEDGFE